VSSPAVANGVVYVGGGKRLDAVDARSGKRLWSVRTTGELANSSPVVANGALYVVDSDGVLYRYDLGS
jgi:outer membrane protein assembly factor BamB